MNNPISNGLVIKLRNVLDLLNAVDPIKIIYAVNDRVVVFNVGNGNRVGTVRGLACEAILDIYTVELDEPFEGNSLVTVFCNDLIVAK